jgi:hypothetical protein
VLCSPTYTPLLILQVAQLGTKYPCACVYENMLTCEGTRAEVIPENLWYATAVDESVRASLGQRRDRLVADIARLLIGALQCHTFSSVGRREFED